MEVGCGNPLKKRALKLGFLEEFPHSELFLTLLKPGIWIEKLNIFGHYKNNVE